jgi:hypothetical protein
LIKGNPGPLTEMLFKTDSLGKEYSSMKIHARLEKLEKKVIGDDELWAVFLIGYYECSKAKKKAEDRLVAEYLNKGNPSPTHRLFIRSIPSTSLTIEEKFLYSFKY